MPPRSLRRSRRGGVCLRVQVLGVGNLGLSRPCAKPLPLPHRPLRGGASMTPHCGFPRPIGRGLPRPRGFPPRRRQRRRAWSWMTCCFPRTSCSCSSRSRAAFRAACAEPHVRRGGRRCRRQSARSGALCARRQHRQPRQQHWPPHRLPSQTFAAGRLRTCRRDGGAVWPLVHAQETRRSAVAPHHRHRRRHYPPRRTTPSSPSARAGCAGGASGVPPQSRPHQVR